MTRDGYANIMIGMSISDIRQTYGEPYKIYSKGEDQVIYEYGERIRVGGKVIEQRRYYLVVAKGKVIEKYMKLSNPPPFRYLYSDDPYPNY